MKQLSDTIRSIPDFPKKGIMFRDITTLLKDAEALQTSVNLLKTHYEKSRIDKVVCIESRGFILGSALAVSLGAGFVPIRKKGKLPSHVIREEYALEYGTDVIEMHMDALQPGDRILLHDDLLATGGTMCAAVKLVEQLHATIVGISFLIELSFLQGRTHLKDFDIYSLVQYDRES
ncbi:MAG: adenine phosphoribosyltransferase [Ignavibacteriae bacterium]|nr:MAG: adenine phosphoribosyltransferase [Ignavibacteriota bacterium]